LFKQNPHLYRRDVENIVNAILGEIVAAMAATASSCAVSARFRSNSGGRTTAAIRAPALAHFLAGSGLAALILAGQRRHRLAGSLPHGDLPPSASVELISASGLRDSGFSTGRH
jgi:hypothetical protein